MTSPAGTQAAPVRFPPGEAERGEARQLAERVLALDQRLGRIVDIDLRSALEQALFLALREFVTLQERMPQRTRIGLPRHGLAFGRSWARLAVATVRRGWWRQPPEPGGILLVATSPTHERLFEPVAEVLQRLGAPPVAVVTAGSWVRSRDVRPKHASTSGSRRPSLRIEEVLDAQWIGPLAAHAARLAWRGPVLASLGVGPPARSDGVWRALSESAPRSALIGARLETLVQRARPGMLVAFNEVGVWGRLVPEAAHRHGIPAVDLPHAEAADPWATVGISYDAVAVYGPRAVEAIRIAGVPPDRIVPVGSVRYDNLVRQASADGDATRKGMRPKIRRVVFASQPARSEGSPLTPAVKAIALRSALGAATAVAPSELVIRPHPLETDDVVARVLPTLAAPADVTVRVELATDLHELLQGAWLLVTAWSQSVLDATIAGVPSITVNPTGGPDPVTFADEGLATGTHDPESAAMAAKRLLEPAARQSAIDGARAALRLRLGEVDGRAAERTAELIARVLRG